MKKLFIVLGLLVCLSSFGRAEIGIIKPELGLTTSEKILYVTGSLALIYAGTHTMLNNSNNDLVTNLTGAGVTFIGGGWLYVTLFEF